MAAEHLPERTRALAHKSNVVEEIPLELGPAAEAALEWDASQPIELGLVLCDGDQCLRENVRVQAQGRDFEITAIEADHARIPPHLDPPVGVRRNWLDEQLAKHALVVIVFYRGFW